MNTSALIQKVWNFCHTLKDDGVGYGDYLEQLTFLLFLKMADEQARPAVHQAVAHLQGQGLAGVAGQGRLKDSAARLRTVPVHDVSRYPLRRRSR